MLPRQREEYFQTVLLYVRFTVRFMFRKKCLCCQRFAFSCLLRRINIVRHNRWFYSFVLPKSIMCVVQALRCTHFLFHRGKTAPDDTSENTRRNCPFTQIRAKNSAIQKNHSSVFLCIKTPKSSVEEVGSSAREIVECMFFGFIVFITILFGMLFDFDAFFFLFEMTFFVDFHFLGATPGVLGSIGRAFQ